MGKDDKVWVFCSIIHRESFMSKIFSSLIYKLQILVSSFWSISGSEISSRGRCCDCFFSYPHLTSLNPPASVLGPSYVGATSGKERKDRTGFSRQL